MLLSDYVHSQKISIKQLSVNTSIPYSTLNEIVNGKTELPRVRFEIIKALSKQFGMSLDEFNQKFIEENELPHFRCGHVVIRNKTYYLLYDIKGMRGSMELLSVNPTNSQYIKWLAKQKLQSKYQEITDNEKIKRIKRWEPENSI